MSHLPIQHKKRNYAGQSCQLADSRLKLYWEAKLRSIDSCQNRTWADQYQKTNNVGSGSLRYTIWHFLPQAGRICLTHTRSLLIGQLHDDVIWLQLPEFISFALLFKIANPAED